MKGSTSAAAWNLNKHDDVFCLTPYWKDKVNTFYGYNTDDFTGGLAQESSKETDFFCLQDNLRGFALRQGRHRLFVYPLAAILPINAR